MIRFGTEPVAHVSPYKRIDDTRASDGFSSITPMQRFCEDKAEQERIWQTIVDSARGT